MSSSCPLRCQPRNRHLDRECAHGDVLLFSFFLPVAAEQNTEQYIHSSDHYGYDLQTTCIGIGIVVTRVHLGNLHCDQWSRITLSCKLGDRVL